MTAAELLSTRRHARLTPGHAARVAAAVTQLYQAADAHAPRVVQATSLGAADMVITDIIARQGLPIAVATIETGALHPPSLALVPRIESHYGIAIERWAPTGEPLARLLAGRSAWVSGWRRDRSASRAPGGSEQRGNSGLTRIDPLADWTEADVWQYIAEYGVPCDWLLAPAVAVAAATPG